MEISFKIGYRNEEYLTELMTFRIDLGDDIYSEKSSPNKNPMIQINKKLNTTDRSCASVILDEIPNAIRQSKILLSICSWNNRHAY